MVSSRQASKVLSPMKISTILSKPPEALDRYSGDNWDHLTLPKPRICSHVPHLHSTMSSCHFHYLVIFIYHFHYLAHITSSLHLPFRSYRFFFFYFLSHETNLDIRESTIGESPPWLDFHIFIVLQVLECHVRVFLNLD